MKKVITYQSPSGRTINLTPAQVERLFRHLDTPLAEEYLGLTEFSDPESGRKLIGSRGAEKVVDGQRWIDTTVAGVRWAIPEGWPNNASPICEESEPEAYHAIF